MSFWERAYKVGWASKDDLNSAVQWNEITPEEYKQITKEDYVAPAE
ncbi:XkdX family protein [Heyndrickxia sp. FSL W8-0496]